MTPEQLEEVPGIGEKTVEKISVAVRHYFGQYEEGEERPEPDRRGGRRTRSEESSMEKTPEAILRRRSRHRQEQKEINNLSAEDIAEREEANQTATPSAKTMRGKRESNWITMP